MTTSVTELIDNTRLPSSKFSRPAGFFTILSPATPQETLKRIDVGGFGSLFGKSREDISKSVAGDATDSTLSTLIAEYVDESFFSFVDTSFLKFEPSNMTGANKSDFQVAGLHRSVPFRSHTFRVKRPEAS